MLEGSTAVSFAAATQQFPNPWFLTCGTLWQLYRLSKQCLHRLSTVKPFFYKSDTLRGYTDSHSASEYGSNGFDRRHTDWMSNEPEHIQNSLLHFQPCWNSQSVTWELSEEFACCYDLFIVYFIFLELPKLNSWFICTMARHFSTGNLQIITSQHIW